MVSEKIGLLSINCNFHAKELADKVHKDKSCYFSGYDYFEVLKSERIPYLMGFYCNNRKTLEAHYNLMDCNPSSKVLYQRPAIIHWLGTDIMNAQTLFETGEVRMFEKLSHGAIIHFVHLQEHLDEMKQIMPHATYLLNPLPPYIIHDVTPFEEKKMISVYMPTMRQDFFRFEEIVQAARQFPDVKFEFYYYYEKFDGEIPIRDTVNCFTVGARDEQGMRDQVRRSRAFIRIPVHDGLSVQALEFATAGRPLIYNKHLPFVNEVDCSDKTKIVDALIAQIEKVLQIEEPIYEMADLYRKEYGHQAYIDRVANAVDLFPKKEAVGVVS